MKRKYPLFNTSIFSHAYLPDDSIDRSNNLSAELIVIIDNKSNPKMALLDETGGGYSPGCHLGLLIS